MHRERLLIQRKKIVTISENIKILLVEDAVTMRKIEINTLNSLGFRNVIEADDGKVAVDTVNRPITHGCRQRARSIRSSSASRLI